MADSGRQQAFERGGEPLPASSFDIIGDVILEFPDMSAEPAAQLDPAERIANSLHRLGVLDGRPHTLPLLGRSETRTLFTESKVGIGKPYRNYLRLLEVRVDYTQRVHASDWLLEVESCAATQVETYSLPNQFLSPTSGPRHIWSQGELGVVLNLFEGQQYHGAQQPIPGEGTESPIQLADTLEAHEESCNIVLTEALNRDDKTSDLHQRTFNVAVR